MKNILIIGAHGKIGQLLSKQLSHSSNYKPTAFIREESQKSDFAGNNMDFLVGDLEESVEDLKKKFDGYDAVVFTAGSGGSTGSDMTLAIDLDGAVRTVEAAKKARIERYIMVSASGADDREFWDRADMKPYYIAKHYADRMLQQSALKYTILRPVALTDDTGKGMISASVDRDGLSKEIAREDVASAISHILDREDTFGKIIEMSQGDQSIDEAISAAVHKQLEIA